jgi:hypothetical protein
MARLNVDVYWRTEPRAFKQVERTACRLAAVRV